MNAEGKSGKIDNKRVHLIRCDETTLGDKG